LWPADVNYSTRTSIFKSLKEKMKVLLTKTDQCHHGDKIQKNQTWNESFAKWVDYGNRNPHRKNRIPIDEHCLSSWVHKQRKAFKANRLSKERRNLLERNGFVFDARFVFAAYGIDASSHGVGSIVAGPSTFINSISQSKHYIS